METKQQRQNKTTPIAILNCFTESEYPRFNCLCASSHSEIRAAMRRTMPVFVLRSSLRAISEVLISNFIYIL